MKESNLVCKKHRPKQVSSTNYTRKMLAEKLGVGIETLRYYEKIQIIPSPERAKNGYRIYTNENAAQIEHVLKAKKYGFTLEEIKIIMGRFNDAMSKEELIEIFSMKIDNIDRQIFDLTEIKSKLIDNINLLQQKN